MDILVENCPNAVLKRTVAAAKLIKSCGNGTRGQLDIKRKQKENILGEETADSAVAAAVSTDGIHSFQSQESRLRLRRVVANLRTATLSSANCASGNSGMIFKRAGSFVEVPSIEELLPKILQDLREVYVSMDTFRNEEARSGFFRRVSVQLQTVKVVLRLWSEFENALEGYEHENVSPEPSDLVPAVDCAPDIPWVKACRNELCFPRYQRREEARKTGEALMTTEQYMPRGGILILRDWSLEVGHIVQSILDVSFLSKLIANQCMSSIALNVSLRPSQTRNEPRSLPCKRCEDNVSSLERRAADRLEA